MTVKKIAFSYNLTVKDDKRSREDLEELLKYFSTHSDFIPLFSLETTKKGNIFRIKFAKNGEAHSRRMLTIPLKKTFPTNIKAFLTLSNVSGHVYFSSKEDNILHITVYYPANSTKLRTFRECANLLGLDLN